MSRHPLVPLREVLELELDEVRVEPEVTYPMAGVYSFGRGLFAKAPIRGDETSHARLFRLHAGQFAYSRLFAWEGALATVTPRLDGLFVSSEFPTFRVRPEMASAEFMAWICRWPPLWESLKDRTTGLGLRRQRVPVERLLDASVPLPDLDEQRRIVARLERAERLRDRARAAAVTSELLLQSVVARSLG
jgi:type I restriction enzyme, S subunit